MKIEVTEYCPKCKRERPSRTEGHSALGNSYLTIFCAVCGSPIRTVHPEKRKEEK